MKKHEIFETNPKLPEVHMTSDGEYFYNNNDAKMHAKTLEDKSVELIVNPDLIEVVAEVDFEGEAPKVDETPKEDEAPKEEPAKSNSKKAK